MLWEILDGVLGCATSFVDDVATGFWNSLTEGPPNSPLFEDHSRKRRRSSRHSGYDSDMGTGTGESPQKRRLINRWQCLYRELYGLEGFLDEFQSCSAIRREIADLEAKRPAVRQWRRLHREVYGYEGYVPDWQSREGLLADIGDFAARKALIPEWHRQYLETYGTEGCLSDTKTSADIQRDIDNFIEIKSLWQECVRYFQSLGGNVHGLSCRPSTPGEIRSLMEGWYRLAVLEEKLRSGAHPAVCGTIVGHERRKDEMGFESWVFKIAADDGGEGILPVGALNRAVRNNVCQDYQRRTGKALRSFLDAYPLYDKRRVRAKIAAMSDWKQDGNLPKYEFADGVVAGYEGRGMRPVPPAPENPGEAGASAEVLAGGESRGAQPSGGPALRVGDVVVGRVKNTMPYGAFVDIGGGVTGLIHLKEAGVGYVEDVAALFGAGEAVKVEIIGLSADGNRQKVALRLLEFQDKAPIAPGGGQGKPTLLLDGVGLWKTLDGGQGETLALLYAVCKKARFWTVLVLDEDTAAEMERAGGGGFSLLHILRKRSPAELLVCSKGPDSVAAAMRRRACARECRIVGNDSALGGAVGLAPCGVVADGSGVAVPELGLRGGPEMFQAGNGARGNGNVGATQRTDGPAAGAQEKILVDGMNCIWSFGVRGIAGILAVLKAAGWKPYTVFDASMWNKRLGQREPGLQEYIEKLTVAGEGCVAPSGSKAGDYLLLMADRCGWGVVSNNRFEGMEEKYPWLARKEREGRRVHTVAVIDGKVVIPTLDICEAMPGGE